MTETLKPMPLEMQEIAYAALEKEIKLHINKQLFNKGYITEQMFLTAKQRILQS